MLLTTQGLKRSIHAVSNGVTKCKKWKLADYSTVRMDFHGEVDEITCIGCKKALGLIETQKRTNNKVSFYGSIMSDLTTLRAYLVAPEPILDRIIKDFKSKEAPLRAIWIQKD